MGQSSPGNVGRNQIGKSDQEVRMAAKKTSKAKKKAPAKKAPAKKASKKKK